MKKTFTIPHPDKGRVMIVEGKNKVARKECRGRKESDQRPVITNRKVKRARVPW
jgi:hypothetical protein